MIIFDHINPVWNIEDFKVLNYQQAAYKGLDLLDAYIEAGHSVESVKLYNYFEPNPMPVEVYNYIKPHFSFLNNVSIAVNLFNPGQFIPRHSDRYDKYKELHDLKSIKNIVRFVVMLEDGLSGQILQIENKVYSFWKAGDCFGWSESTPHAFYNFSTAKRYAMQITGVFHE
jgi:hypothetical protein